MFWIWVIKRLKWEVWYACKYLKNVTKVILTFSVQKLESKTVTCCHIRSECWLPCSFRCYCFWCSTAYSQNNIFIYQEKQWCIFTVWFLVFRHMNQMTKSGYCQYWLAIVDRVVSGVGFVVAVSACDEDVDVLNDVLISGVVVSAVEDVFANSATETFDKYLQRKKYIQFKLI